MSRKKQKLELTWIGKDDRPKLEPRILIEDPELSYHANKRHSDDDIFDNMLIHGDNLLALKALEADYSGKVKCIYIDPPYNTGNAFEHYDDGVEHSLWLSLMRDRLEVLRNLLADDGAIWITLDDNEAHYLKVMCDEIFGRSNFLGTIVWQHSVQGKGYSGKLSLHHNYVLGYRKTEKFILRDLPREAKHNKAYSNSDNDPKGEWRTGDVRNALYRPNLIYDIETPSGKIISPPEKGWRWSKETLQKKIETGEIYFSPDETRIIRKIYLKDQSGRVPETIWFGEDVGTTRAANKEQKDLNDGEVQAFATPKPEKLLERILIISSNSGDLVLDSFAGSGTTGAVAHKMGRKWLMIELGDHCQTHIVPRLQKVIDGSDKGGISETVNWQGGGGFRYYHLAPSLLEKDKYGNWVISQKYNATMLAEAVCKNMGFTYDPSQDENEYWRHGHSTETDFIFVTTTSMTHSALKKLSEDVGPDRTLFVCCKAFNADADAFDNLTIKKIPHAVLTKCEWGQDDYSLNVENLPMAKSEAEKEQESLREELPLFGQDDTKGEA
ncbi:MAG: site-specific DNA-methyltransferase [Kordiimonas sp.]|nr:site-specific DNA-methyltransferase [Kordiimonas sp.]|tara:strand:- start:352 stop:2010 length:1659 start_codon:yes stop_codon:yes gene_type:complete